MISGILAIQRKPIGTTYLASRTAMAISRAVPRNDSSIGAMLGSSKLGCRAMTMIAQMSWKISSPSEMRPTSVSSWNVC